MPFPTRLGRLRPMRLHLLDVEYVKVQIALGRGFAFPARISNCCTNVLGVPAGGLELFECHFYLHQRAPLPFRCMECRAIGPKLSTLPWPTREATHTISKVMKHERSGARAA